MITELPTPDEEEATVLVLVRGGFGQKLRQISPSVNFDFSGMYVRKMSLTPGFGRLLNGYVRTTGISAAAGVRSTVVTRVI